MEKAKVLLLDMKNFCHVSWGPGFPFPLRVLIFIACEQLLSEQWDGLLFTYSWVQETHVCTQSSASAVQGTHRDRFRDRISSCYAHVWVCTHLCMHACVCVCYKDELILSTLVGQHFKGLRVPGTTQRQGQPTLSLSFYSVLWKDECCLKHPENAAVGLICVPAFFFLRMEEVAVYQHSW